MILSEHVDGEIPAVEIIKVLAAKLAEYEDTGFDPEDLKKVLAGYRYMSEKAEPLMKAQAEGRVLILPVPLGSPVYPIDWCGGTVDGESCPYDCNSVQRSKVFSRDCIRY